MHCSPWRCLVIGSLRVALLALPVSSAAEPAPAAGLPAGGANGFFRLPQFRRGEANGDGRYDMSDAIFTLDALFTGGAAPGCLDAADANGDGEVDVSDSIRTLRYLFLGAEPPPAPGPDECGVDRRPDAPGCLSYAHCPDDFPLIAHVLSRVTYGATSELYERIQTRAELVAYLHEQLDEAPADYDPAVHEPEVAARLAELDAIAPGEGGQQQARFAITALKSQLLIPAVMSRWQLLHVIAQFWNNHFHTQVDALSESFFSNPPRGGQALRATAEMFAAADIAPADAAVSEAEWAAFRVLHPGAEPWEEFPARPRQDGALSLQEFLDLRSVAAWKYFRGGIAAVSGDMERREHTLFRRLAFGDFRSLLDASARSVAMLIYLNGFENTVRAPNENYAREIFELHSLGADVAYTQRDVEELARIFTGWTADWVARAGYPAGDINFQGRPDSQTFPLNLREPPPFRFPTRQFWDDDLYTWGFVVRTGAHDWGRKDLFLQRYGGTDSLGNPLSPRAELAIAANDASRTVSEAISEYTRFLDRLLALRDVPKFISTKLIQLLVTDDLALLEKSLPMPADLRVAFEAVDANGDSRIDAAEWEAPVPLVLPAGRPPHVFERLDADGDGFISSREYQEPDLLVQCIDVWRASQGSIREVLRAILLSEELLGLKFRRAKVKTPFEVVTSAARALQGVATNQHLVRVVEDLAQAGMELYSFSDPTGESELGIDWMHTIGLLERLKHLNRAANPAGAAESRLTWSPQAFQSRWGLSTPEEAVDFFLLLLTGGDVLPEQRQLALQAYSAAPGNKVQAAVGFILSLPQFEKQ